MSQGKFFGKFFAFSYRQLFLALVSMAAVGAAGLLFAPEASAQLTVGGGGTCTTSSKCALGSPLNTPFNSSKKKFCSCPQINVGYCTTCTQACSSSCLGGSTWALFSGAQLPIETDDDGINEAPNPCFLSSSERPAGCLPSTSETPYDITGGPSFRLQCTQGAAQCPLGIPVVQSTQQGVMFTRSSQTITLAAPIAGLPTLATPDAPFKVQVAGTNRNNGLYTVVGVNSLALTVLERLNNETATATVALANIKLTFIGAGPDPENPGPAKVYFRHLSDPVAGQEPQCVVVPGNKCEDGVATAVGSFNAQVKCANTGTQLKLPCEVQGFAGKSALALNSQEATFTFPANDHNFTACGGGNVDCAIGWSDPDKVNNQVCKKFFPAVTNEWQLCQTLKFTITAGASISNFMQRAFNSEMAPASEAPTFTFFTSTNTPAGVPVDIKVIPDGSLNAAQGGTFSVRILNNGAANLEEIDVGSVALWHSNYAAAVNEPFQLVPNTGAPEACSGQSNCWVFKFNRGEFFDTYLAVHPELNCQIPDGHPLPVNLTGAYGEGGEVAGKTTAVVNGTYGTPCN